MLTSPFFFDLRGPLGILKKLRRVWDFANQRAQLRGWNGLPGLEPCYNFYENHRLVPKESQPEREPNASNSTPSGESLE